MCWAGPEDSLWLRGIFLVSYVILGGEVLLTALKNLTRGHVFDENFLMSIATLGALCIDNFPEAVGVMLFYRAGEYFEHRAVEKSRSQIMEAVDLRPEVVERVLGEGKTENHPCFPGPGGRHPAGASRRPGFPWTALSQRAKAASILPRLPASRCR